MEGDLRVGFIDDALVSYVQQYDAQGFPTGNAEYQTLSQPDVFFVLPTRGVRLRQHHLRLCRARTSAPATGWR